jgi:hypothetical protein
MYELTTAFLQSELDYRTARVRTGVAKRPRRRIPRVRRPAEVTDAR